MDFLSHESPLENFKFQKELYINLIDQNSSANKEFFNSFIESYSNWVDFKEDTRILSVLTTTKTVLTYSISFDRFLDTLDGERINEDQDHTFCVMLSKDKNVCKIGNSIIDVNSMLQLIFTDNTCSSLTWWNPDIYSVNELGLAIEGIERNEDVSLLVQPALIKEQGTS
ncbi:hypothetical protein [uncultured Corynebacterium sp.]|uniref:hypothetical protein n=1 Tax=uncultured Corynebacterium sp. TaxID=159447 RepID=UPI0025E1EE65|nr:hypothetical protein [uncultured Corynebacterium sp.]